MHAEVRLAGDTVPVDCGTPGTTEWEITDLILRRHQSTEPRLRDGSWVSR